MVRLKLISGKRPCLVDPSEACSSKLTAQFSCLVVVYCLKFPRGHLLTDNGKHVFRNVIVIEAIVKSWLHLTFLEGHCIVC